MLKHFFVLAWRNLLYYRGITGINLLGLTVGIASCMLMLIYVRFEMSYDRFHPQADQIFRILTVDEAFGVTYKKGTLSISALAGAMQQELPEVTEVVRMKAANGQIEKGTKRFNLKHVWLAEPSFQEMWDFGLLHGKAQGALSEPNTALISASTALKLFNREEVVGESLTFSGREVRITAVLPDAPANSHLQYEVVISMITPPADTAAVSSLYSWHGIDMLSYVKLGHADQERLVTAKMIELLGKHKVYEAIQASLQPLTEIHLGSQGIISDSYNYKKGDKTLVLTLLLISFLVLLLAAFNYVNLATARSLRRAREVGLRKVVGAYRTDLIAQFLLEAIFLTVGAFVLALGVVFLVGEWIPLLPVKPAMYLFQQDTVLLYYFLGGVCLLGIVAGSYPAFLLSNYDPIEVLRGRFQRSGKGIWLRRMLVTGQFSVSMALIVSTLVVYQQLNLMREMDKGFEPEQVLTFSLTNSSLAENYKNLRNSFLQIPGVRGVATTTTLPGQPHNRSSGIKPEGYEGEGTWVVNLTTADEHFLEVMGMQIVSGRGFDPSFGLDPFAGVLINQSMASSLGWEEPVGKRIQLGAGYMTVAGVVRDFHFGGMRQKIEPLLMVYQPGAIGQVAVKVQTEDLSKTLSAMAESWEQINPHDPFDYQFFDEEFARQFEQKQAFAHLAMGFTWLALIIACLGQLGLSTFAAQQRIKEIGIRKVLGASVTQLMTLLSRELVILIGLAALIALPFIAILMENWLTGYAYRIELPWWGFVGAIAMTLTLALLINGYHSLDAAKKSPIHALRNE